MWIFKFAFFLEALNCGRIQVALESESLLANQLAGQPACWLMVTGLADCHIYDDSSLMWDY